MKAVDPVGKRSLRWEELLKRFVLSQEWKSEGVMDDESGDDNRDELTSEWGGEARHDWRGWRNESGSWFQRRGDAYLNERSAACCEPARHTTTASGINIYSFYSYIRNNYSRYLKKTILDIPKQVRVLDIQKKLFWISKTIISDVRK